MYLLKTWILDIWWEYFPVLEIFVFSSLKTLCLQKWTPHLDDCRGFIDLFIFSSSLHLVAQVWWTFISFPSATKPGTKPSNRSEFSIDLCYHLLKAHPCWHGQDGFPKKCRNFFIQGSTFTPGMGLHHSPRAPEATVTHCTNGRVKGARTTSAGLGPESPLQTLPGILGFLLCLKKRRQTTKQTTRLQSCVSGRDGEFTLTQQNLIPRTQQMLFCWNSVILSSRAICSLSQTQRCCFVWLTGTSFPANHSLHTRNVFWMCREAKSDRPTQRRET